MEDETMQSNLEKYRQDLDNLIEQGEILENLMRLECFPDKFKQLKKKYGKLRFSDEYQKWYSESLVLLKFLLPDRVDDFKKLYEKPKNRKSIDIENYTIEDYLQRNELGEVLVKRENAIPKFEQQLAIIKSAKKRFESSLFDIKQLVQADLFDSELGAARELNKKGFTRGAGAMAGVVLEKHLAQVCENHQIKVTKKDPSINDYNQLLKDRDVIEIKDWRFIQHLTDLRNLCDHDKKREPKKEEIEELINGVEKIIKTIF
jgi:hypothetical protein